ncbi:MAG: hypothetical protein O7C59_05585, partial [Rickettsia endosymbiont of Ixodes persulcatus]|nr:hypothetical protein [Rickettsia endosymbiont of Ixodes persulcatus]
DFVNIGKVYSQNISPLIDLSKNELVAGAILSVRAYGACFACFPKRRTRTCWAVKIARWTVIL